MSNTSAIRAGRAFVELFADDTKLARGLKSAEKRLRSWGQNVAKIGAAIFGAGMAMLTPFALSVKTFADSGDKLAKMSDRTGIGVTALSELGYAAEQSGTNMETFEGSMRKMQKFIAEAAGGSSEAGEELDKLGLTLGDLNGLKPDQQFQLIADRISKITSPSLKAAAAMAIFGKSGTALLPLMKDGAKGIQELREEARRLGLAVSEDDARAAEVLGDRWSDLGKIWKATKFAIGAELAPALTELLKDAIGLAIATSRWIKQNKALFVMLAKGAVVVAAIGAAIVTFGGAMILTGAAIGGFLATMAALKSALVVLGGAVAFLAAFATPGWLAVGVVVALTGAFVTLGLKASGALTYVGRVFKAVFGGIRDALMSADLSLAFAIMMQGALVTVQKGILKIRQALGIATKAAEIEIAFSETVLQLLIARAAAKADAFRNQTFGGAAKMTGPEDDLDNAKKQIERLIAARGTFNPAAVSRMGQSPQIIGLLRLQLEAQKKIVENTKRDSQGNRAVGP